jgi:hypothetical protein
MTTYSARLMFISSYGLLPKDLYEYFRPIDEPDFYFWKLGKKPLDYWEKEFSGLGLSIETELNNIIHLVRRNSEDEVILGIRLENL